METVLDELIDSEIYIEIKSEDDIITNWKTLQKYRSKRCINHKINYIKQEDI